MSDAEHLGARSEEAPGRLRGCTGVAATFRFGALFLFSAASFFAMGCFVPRRDFLFVHFERELAITVAWYLATCVAVGLLARRRPSRFGPAMAGASVIAALAIVSPITQRAIQYGRPTEAFFDALMASPPAHAADYGILALGALLAARMAWRPPVSRASDGAVGPGSTAQPGGGQSAG